MPTVARYADEWNVPVGIDPAGVRERVAWLGAECARIGRSPCVREVSVFLPLANMSEVPLVGPATRLGARLLYGRPAAVSVLAGSVASTIARIREYADAGATSVIITTRPGLNHDLMRRFAAEVIPAARGS
jgi:alkanesulfonate monooxygenase SsuD/methylene tetrahydromethanopterin reductase-like flavin-dependent oxidoreductase (luciferase family)